MEQSTRSCTKKRKIFDDHLEEEEEEDDDEDEKIETFFALIRRMREARDRLSTTNPGVAKGGSTMVKRSSMPGGSTRTPISGWKPTFQLEDFVPDARRIGADDPQGALTNDSSTQRKVGSEKEHQETKVSLDLTLSL